MSQSVDMGSGIEFGPKRIELIPFTVINELPQVRTDYDPDAIEELARAIWTDRGEGGVTSEDFELANPVLMGRHTLRSAQQYIDNHGEYYRIPSAKRVDPQDLTPADDGRAVILIAGHRRRRAISHLIGQHNISPVQVKIAGNVRDEIEFGEAISLQLRENVYEKPSPQDEARAIDLAYRYLQSKSGSMPSLKRLSTELGFGETKVRDAVAFASLPLSIQEYTNSGVLSYSVTRRLKPLYDVYIRENLYKGQSHQEATKNAELSVIHFCNNHLDKRMHGRSDEKLSLAILNQTRAIEDDLRHQQGSWDFDGLEEKPETRARKSTREMTRTAIAIMRYRVNIGDIDGDEIAALEALLERYRTENEMRQSQELDLGIAEAS